MSVAGGERQRLDKWLWYARVTKSRTLAQKLIAAGRVRVNREKHDSPSHPIAAGDTLTIALESGVKVLRVLAPGTRRGPPAEARTLYEDLTPPEPAIPVALRADGAGRPTKRDRRAIVALKRGEADEE
jgi:ribosome-associated heat shock protein Hsp15